MFLLLLAVVVAGGAYLAMHNGGKGTGTGTGTGTGAGADANGVPLGSGAMFDSIAPYYDRVNRVISMGMDVHWRELLVQRLGLKSGDRLLDLATGTGDVALTARRAVDRYAPDVTIHGVDPSPEMLRRAVDKARAGGYG
eukprot:CAMPEP_0173351680 /NCGR_PEP_ID=MMETSP1144-20121109/15592_1 /TAXON_ID=483371 /ORGANISM="non described non described, Strain CCMP2298" /LENGTH=138 /DNA_ID=CAMNT_0014299801 /DNA_START=1225 /DNA_END=1638 /DNA_ORIENTATION=+